MQHFNKCAVQNSTVSLLTVEGELCGWVVRAWRFQGTPLAVSGLIMQAEKERHPVWWGISGWGHVGEASAVAAGSDPGALTLV